MTVFVTFSDTHVILYNSTTHTFACRHYNLFFQKDLLSVSFYSFPRERERERKNNQIEKVLDSLVLRAVRKVLWVL